MKFFVDFCGSVLRIPDPVATLGNVGPRAFLNLFIQKFYLTQPFQNLEAFNPNSRSNFYHGWRGFLSGSDTFAEFTDDVKEQFFNRRGGMCFHRAVFAHSVLRSAGIDSLHLSAILDSTPRMPHSVLAFPGMPSSDSQYMPGPRELYLADLGNRVAPITQLVSLADKDLGLVIDGPISQSKFTKELVEDTVYGGRAPEEFSHWSRRYGDEDWRLYGKFRLMHNEAFLLTAVSFTWMPEPEVTSLMQRFKTNC